MLLQQPGAATGDGFYERVVSLSDVEGETQPDGKFVQSMECSYRPQPIIESPSTAIAFISLSSATINNDNKNNNKSLVKYIFILFLFL
jgi:hypothetical protein